MFKKANIAEIMREELPPITYQKRLCYRTDYDEVVSLYRILNKTIFNNIMSHGPSFFVFRDKLKKHGISLKGAHSKRKWFKYQNLFKC